MMNNIIPQHRQRHRPQQQQQQQQQPFQFNYAYNAYNEFSTEPPTEIATHFHMQQQENYNAQHQIEVLSKRRRCSKRTFFINFNFVLFESFEFQLFQTSRFHVDFRFR